MVKAIENKPKKILGCQDGQGPLGSACGPGREKAQSENSEVHLTHGDWVILLQHWFSSCVQSVAVIRGDTEAGYAEALGYGCNFSVNLYIFN
jgi:hypothetical protein